MTWQLRQSEYPDTILTDLVLIYIAPALHLYLIKFNFKFKSRCYHFSQTVKKRENHRSFYNFKCIEDQAHREMLILG